MACLVTAAVALAPAPVRAQDGNGGVPSRPPPGAALTYTVRTAEGGWDLAADGGVALPDLDVSGDHWPVEVIQGAEVAWVLAPDRPPRVRDADWVLLGNVPVTEGPGSALIRGWAPAHLAYDAFELSLRRGERDRTIAGRPAEHHRLEARIDRTVTAPSEWEGGAVETAGEATRQRVRVTADVWVLPGVPFSWAPFGADGRAIPTFLPRLRDALEPRLEALGLVGRAVVRVEVRTLQGAGSSGDSERVTAFEISDLGEGAAPPISGTLVDRGLVDAVERLATRHPGRVCTAAAAGELPPVLRSRVTPRQRAPLLELLSARCER